MSSDVFRVLREKWSIHREWYVLLLYCLYYLIDVKVSILVNLFL